MPERSVQQSGHVWHELTVSLSNTASPIGPSGRLHGAVFFSPENI
jgi:hypothetical protein